VDRVVVLGFEVRLQLNTDTGPLTAQITRGDAEALGLRRDDTVFVRATQVPQIGGKPQRDSRSHAAAVN
jgi:sulfate/thiosulfate transport system ATP-binding protein